MKSMCLIQGQSFLMFVNDASSTRHSRHQHIYNAKHRTQLTQYLPGNRNPTPIYLLRQKRTVIQFSARTSDLTTWQITLASKINAMDSERQHDVFENALTKPSIRSVDYSPSTDHSRRRGNVPGVPGGMWLRSRAPGRRTSMKTFKIASPVSTCTPTSSLLAHHLSHLFPNNT